MVQPPWRQEPGFDEALERAGHALATVTLGELDGGRRSVFLLVFGGRRGNTLFSDVLAFNVARREWSLWCERWPSAPRSYHTATVINGEVWLCGGGDSSQVLPDVLVFNPAMRSWRQAHLQGDVHLLRRTAHGACVHPLRPGSILLMGGYGGPGEDFRYLNDLVEVDTVAGSVRAVRCIGSPPELRAYHAFVACGSRCYCVAGRMHDNRLVKGKQILVVWDASTSKWIVPGVVEGDLPPRSSLRVVAVPGGALAFGGAVDRGAKSAELHLLTGQGRLSWRACQLGTAGPMPAARGAHAMEVVGGRLYVVGGYGEGKQYTADCWSLSLEAVAGCETAPLARPQKDAGAKQSGGSKAAAVPEASQWREARRSCPAAAFGAGSSKRQRLAAPSAAPTGAKAALPPSSGAVPATMVALPSATPVACTPAAAAMHAAVPPHSMPQQQQAAQQAPAAVALVPCMTELAELQQALHRERAAAVALQQQLADVMRESGEARADAAAWRRKAEEEQQLASQANAVLQQRTAEVGDLQLQLRAAQLEGGRAESELLELRSQQRRERDRAEREAMDRDRRVQQLEQELQAERTRNDRLSESVAQHTAMVAQLQRSVHEEQQRASELRVALAGERDSLTHALRDEQDKARQAAQQRDHCQLQLESEQRQLREAKEIIERQQAQVREAEEKARQVQEECRRARDEAEEARRLKHAAEEAAGRARAALARIQRAQELLQQAEEDMAGLGT